MKVWKLYKKLTLWKLCLRNGRCVFTYENEQPQFEDYYINKNTEYRLVYLTL